MIKLRWIFLLGFLCGVALLLTIGAGNDTINSLPAAGSAFFTSLTTFLQNEAADRYANARTGPFVFSGGTHGTAVGKTSAAFATVAYTEAGNRISQAAAAIDYDNEGCADDDTAWVIASAMSADTSGNFARVGATDYFVNCTDAAQPALPSDAAWLMEVTISGAAITAVTDLRRSFPVGFDAAERFMSFAAAVDEYDDGGDPNVTITVSSRMHIEANVTTTANITVWFLQSGIVEPANGVTFTANGPVKAGPYQICDISQGGVCTFPGTAQALPEWWGSFTGTGSNDQPILTAAGDSMRRFLLRSDTYNTDPDVGSAGEGWTIHGDDTFVIGTGSTSILKGETQNKSFLQIGDPAQGERINFAQVGFLKFEDQPDVAGGGGDNNNHPLHFISLDYPIAFFNYFVDDGLGIRFGRCTGISGCTVAPSPEGTRGGLAIGNTFEDPRAMTVEIMDDTSIANQVIATRILNPDKSGNGEDGSTQSHAVRMNGRFTQVIGLEAMDGMATLGTWAGGYGHMMVGGTHTGHADAIQVLDADGNTGTKYGIASSIIAGDGDDDLSTHLADIGDGTHEITDFILGPAIGFTEAAVTSQKRGVFINNPDSKYIMAGPVIVAKPQMSGTDSANDIDGSFHYLNIITHDTEDGANAVRLRSSSADITGNLSVDEGSPSVEPTSIRVDGTGHTLRLHGKYITVSGTQHVLDIRQHDSTGNVVISANNSIIRVSAEASVTVNGDNNDITMQSVLAAGTSITLNAGADWNNVRGLADVASSDSGSNNDLTGLRTY